jgi:hypothetical protein
LVAQHLPKQHQHQQLKTNAPHHLKPQTSRQPLKNHQPRQQAMK